MKRGEIYLLNLEKSDTHIQSGTRPVIIIQNNTGNAHSNTTIVCAITSRQKRKLPTHLAISGGGLNEPSTVLCEQIFTISKDKLLNRIGAITDEYTLNKLDKCIQTSLSLK